MEKLYSESYGKRITSDRTATKQNTSAPLM